VGIMYRYGVSRSRIPDIHWTYDSV